MPDDVWLPASLVAAWLRVSRRHVPRLAAEHGWRTKGENRHTRYLADDVGATLGERKQPMSRSV